MEEAAAFQDWEFLQVSDAALIPGEYGGGDAANASEGIDGGGSEDGAIKPDYFTLDSERRHYPRITPSEDETESVRLDSNNPSWMDPESHYRSDNRRNSGGFWSDDSSDGRETLAGTGSEKGELLGIGDSTTQLGHLDSGGIAGGFAEELPRDDELVKVRGGTDASDAANDFPIGEGEKRGSVWWKMPFELLKLCVLRVRPLWSISIAAAFVGFFMLGRRLHKMRSKSRGIQLKIAIDNKKTTQLMARAARFNEAFSVVRRIPIMKSPLPAAAGGMTPWIAVPFS